MRFSNSYQIKIRRNYTSITIFYIKALKLGMEVGAFINTKKKGKPQFYDTCYN